MLDRTAEQVDVQPSRLVADAGYGSAEMLGWLVDERGTGLSDVMKKPCFASASDHFIPKSICASLSPDANDIIALSRGTRNCKPDGSSSRRRTSSLTSGGAVSPFFFSTARINSSNARWFEP
jgi:hypothetical protein